MITVKEEFLTEHKTLKAIKMGGYDVVALWLAMKGYSSRERTAGFVPDEVIELLPGVPKRPHKPLRALVECGLINESAYGWIIPEDVPRLTWSKKHYRTVAERDGWACRYCGSSGPLTIDHVVPRCQGGDDEPNNLVVACRACNCRKGGRTPEQAGMVLL